MCKHSKYLPSKEIIYGFIFNLFSLLIMLCLGYSLVDTRLADYQNRQADLRNLLENQRNFIHDFTLIGQGRIYAAERYYLNVSENFSVKIIDQSWEDYMDTVLDWNRANILNPLFIKSYFGDDYQSQYYNELQSSLVTLHETLLNVRGLIDSDDNDAEQQIENAKHLMFLFSEGLMTL